MAPFLPEPQALPWGGPKPTSNRPGFEGILWGLRSGAHCKDLPASYLLAQHLLAPSAHLGRSAGLADDVARLARTPRSPRATGWGRNLCRRRLCPGQKRGPCVGAAKKGKGMQWVVADGQGVPLGTLLESASPAEVTLSERTLARVSAPRWGRGRPRQKPDRLIDDKSAAADAFASVCGLGALMWWA